MESVRDAANQRDQPDPDTCELSLACCAFILGPYYHTYAQAAVYTDGHQDEDAGEHVVHVHHAVQLTHKGPEDPLKIASRVNDANDSKGCEEEVSAGQVEEPHRVDCFCHPVPCHIDDQTITNGAGHKCHIVDHQGYCRQPAWVWSCPFRCSQGDIQGDVL